MPKFKKPSCRRSEEGGNGGLCRYCKGVDLKAAFEEAWKLDPISNLRRKFREETYVDRCDQISYRVLKLGTISHITSEGNCDLCKFVAASFNHVPQGVRDGIEAASTCHVRLRIAQDIWQEWPWSRYLNKNYLALDPEARGTHERLLELRTEESLSFLFMKQSYTVFIEAPIKNLSNIELDVESDGNAYIPIGCITPVRQKHTFSHYTRYPSYWGYVRDPMPFNNNVHRYAKWLKRCCRTHTGCSLDSNKPPRQLLIELKGFSLIDCVTGKIVPGTAALEYVALSYVWGTSLKASVAESGNLEAQKEYPKTINDARLLTIALGVRYLWVDALCIPSNDSNARAEQIRNMDIIYRCAILVVIAASSESSDDGIHGISLSQLPQLSSIIDGMEVILTDYNYKDCLAMSPWISRGWCFQEGFLAQRRLIFTKKEVFFECREGICHESQADTKLFTRNFSSSHCYFSRFDNSHCFRLNGQLGIYAQLVTSYLQKNLSWESDIVDAFQGISNAMKYSPYHLRYFKSASCWGLPSYYFGAALTWWPIFDPKAPPSRRILSPGTINLPCWSWTAWRMKEIDYTRKMRLQVKPLPTFDWSDETWSKISETGIVEFEAEVVSFENSIEVASTEEDLEFDITPAWSQRKGSFLSIKDWQGSPESNRCDIEAPTLSKNLATLYRFDTPGRFALRIRKRGDILYRIGHEISIPEDEWLKEEPRRQHVKLG